MSKQLYEVGDVIQAGSTSLEVSGVSYSEPDGTPESRQYTYLMRPHEEVEAERRAEAEHQKALEVAEKENAKLTPVAQSDDEPVTHNEGAED